MLTGCTSIAEYEYNNEYIEIDYTWTSTSHNNELSFKFLKEGTYTIILEGRVVFQELVEAQGRYFTYSAKSDEERLKVEYNDTIVMDIDLP